MARLARVEVFKAEEVGVYHAFNRTCRRCWLHGIDPLTGVDHSHRREWFRDRMRFLSQYFCLDVLAFAVLSNHWHCVLRNRPDLVEQLSDREVAVRWLSLTSRRKCRGNKGGEIREPEILAIVSQPEVVAKYRRRLSDISWFIRLMCQTVAHQCNSEDECTGRFFEERFKLKALESEADVLASMAYVDLNLIRAGATNSLDDPDAHVSISERLRSLDDTAVDVAAWLAPLELASEVDGKPVDVVNRLTPEEVRRKRLAMSEQMGCLPMKLAAYTALLWHLAIESRPELQAHAELTAEQLRAPAWDDGQGVDLEAIRERMSELQRRCDASLSGHACRAIRDLVARSPRPPSRQQHGPPVPR